MHPQDYSLSNHNISNGTPADMSRSGLPPTVIGPGHNPLPPSHTGYQPNLMSIGVDTSAAPVTSMPMSGATPPTLHNSLATYMTQQVPTNLLFGLGQQQTAPAQQQPLNLQTSHQASMQPPPGNHQPPGAPQQHPTWCSSITPQSSQPILCFLWAHVTSPYDYTPAQSSAAVSTKSYAASRGPRRL
ncbi:hypothetical protein Anas_06988 [Armadillidium nasatum]|uniref:Uncharacterized protein n=1 Tax=Armadillidium nasatum TaxID=96803 RepID=A0A5N5SW53_9CRUS|nr:hypothetical protein Anas_06988 [Armadillidium nasatum]